MSATRSPSLSPLQQALVALEAMQRKLNCCRSGAARADRRGRHGVPVSRRRQ